MFQTTTIRCLSPKNFHKENFAIAKQLLTSPKIKAMLDVIIYAEGTGKYGAGTLVHGIVVGFVKSPKNPAWQNWVTNKVHTKNIQITDFSRHPYVLVRLSKTLKSTAAGKYQFLQRTWDSLKGVPDFTAKSQDIAAVMLMQRRKMIVPLLNGNVKQASNNGANEWASLPNKNGKSAHGQPVKKIKDLLSIYNTALAKHKSAK